MWAHKFWSSLDNRASPGKEKKGKKGETGEGRSGSGHEREGPASPRGTIERTPDESCAWGGEQTPTYFHQSRKTGHQDRCQRLPRRDSRFCHTKRYLGIDHLAIVFFLKQPKQTNLGTKNEMVSLKEKTKVRKLK